ncbi:MAG: ABC transporter ATP-binding protein [Crenarchaeota archaeon]|nr:ABC transporter ATP-binding protein [Thermoproteota archaeon]
MARPLLTIENLRVYYDSPRGLVKAVDGVSFEVMEGEILGIAGESGCGKSTLIHSLILLKPPMKYAGGKALYSGVNLVAAPPSVMKRIRYREISIIPQYAMNAAPPAKRIRDLVRDLVRSADPDADIEEVFERARERLKLVNLSPRVLDMYPVELSGGMKQRTIMVVSTLLNPKLLLADEITSALDVSTQRVVLELLKDFRDRGIVRSVIFVTHDLASLYQIADRIVVMYAGKVVEIGSADKIIHDPLHPYTKALVSSLPRLGVHYRRQKLSGLAGHPPDLVNPPPGCRFAPRCRYAIAGLCNREEPPTVEVDGRIVSCWIYAKR